MNHIACPAPRRQSPRPPLAPQRGLTMVELLVAMAISTVLALAAISALVVSRQGFTTVDVASQLRDNARFATDLIQRLGVQSGFKDVNYATTQRVTNMAGLATNPDPNISGFNNAVLDPAYIATDPLNHVTANSGINGSDILVLRFQTTETFPGSGVADRSMIDCSGNGSTAVAGNRDDRLISILHVATSEGEPSLMCTTLAPSSTNTYTTTALVRGVETFQVLYGADGVTPGSASAALTPASGGTFGLLPKIFLRADQFDTGTASTTNNNWRRVRALRIGMVLRGPPGSAQDTSANPRYYPLGPGTSSNGGAAGSALSASADVGTQFTPSASQGRLRQTVTFTVHLRNEQGY